MPWLILSSEWVEPCINERVRPSFHQGGRPSSLRIRNAWITFKTRLTANKCFYLDLVKMLLGNVCSTRVLSRCWSGALCPFDRGVMLNACGGDHQIWKCRDDRLSRFVSADGHHYWEHSREHHSISRIDRIKTFLSIKPKSPTGKQSQKRWKRAESPKAGFISVRERLLMENRTQCQPFLNWCLNQLD